MSKSGMYKPKHVGRPPAWDTSGSISRGHNEQGRYLQIKTVSLSKSLGIFVHHKNIKGRNKQRRSVQTVSNSLGTIVQREEGQNEQGC